MHTWLAHLAATAPGLAPAPIGIDAAHGVETVSYLDGDVPTGGAQPDYLWRESTLTEAARLLRRCHDSALSFDPPADALWRPDGACPGGGEVICHNDVAPWNTVFADGLPVAFIDWDLAAPGPRYWDIAYALWHFVPLYGDPGSDPFDQDQFAPRGARARAFCDAYGMRSDGRTGLVDHVIERQSAVYTTIQRGALAGVPAYVRLWALGAGDGIQGQIAFVRDHHGELRDALT